MTNPPRPFTTSRMGHRPSSSTRRFRTAPGASRLRAAPGPDEIVLSDAEDNPGGRLRILLVEDDVRYAELVARILVDAAPEFDLVHAPRLSTALACLVRQRIDMILTDLTLPDSGGPATVRYLVRAAPDVPLIVLSGVSDIDTALECIRDGAEEYVVKRAVDSEGLVRLIRITLARRHRVTEQWFGQDSDRPVVGGPALQAVGTHLLKVADRTGLSISVLSLRVEGRGSTVVGEHVDIAEIAAVLRRTLRRCDVIARVDRNELAAILVGDQAGAEVATRRVADAMLPLQSGASTRVGVVTYDVHHPQSVDELLARARARLRPVTA